MDFYFTYVFLAYLITLTAVEAVPLCGTSVSDRFTEYSSGVGVCLVYNEDSKMIFFPQVDEFTLLEVNGCNAPLYSISCLAFALFGNSLNEGRVLQFEAGGQASTPIRYHTTESTVSFYTAIINLKDGEVRSIEWDTSCSGCSDSLCIDGFCSIPNNNCEAGENCNIQVSPFL